MTIKMPAFMNVRFWLTAAIFCCLLTGCKTAKKADTSDTKVAVSIPPQKINGDQLKQLIRMIKGEAAKGKAARGISVSDTFQFFNLTDDEMNTITAKRSKPTTVQKFVNQGITYYLLKSVGNAVKTSMKSANGYTVYFAPTVNLYVQILSDAVLDICRMEGIQISIYYTWNNLVGFYGDGRGDQAGPSEVISAPSMVYPKNNCALN